MSSSPEHVALAATGPTSLAAGRAVARAGGNAVDVAVAAALAAMSCEPGIVSLGAGAFISIWGEGQEPVVIDGNVEMPGRERPDEAFGQGVREVFVDFYGGMTVFAGHGSVATPGMFAALAEANRLWGSAPWRELVTPAAHFARHGYPLGRSAASYLNEASPLFTADVQTRTFLEQGTGAPPRAGQIMTSPHLATSMEAIAAGVETLYGGELAEVIEADMDAHAGLLTREDLASYRTVIRPALRTRLGEWDIGVNPAPSIGGPVLTAMLRLLADRKLTAGATHALDVADIQRIVLGYRRRAIDHAHDLESAGRELIGLLDELGPEGLEAVCSSPETIHVSVVDADGLACSITTSSGYGSGVTTPHTGLVLNNALGEPELNRRGLHALPPGTRLASNMAPTTARHDGGAALAIGSPGADRITTALFQVLGGVCLDNHPLQQAIDQPRLHIAIDDDGRERMEYEEAPALADAALQLGLPTVVHPPMSMYFGGAGAAARHDDGRLDAAGDPRREAAVGIG